MYSALKHIFLTINSGAYFIFCGMKIQRRASGELPGWKTEVGQIDRLYLFSYTNTD